MKRKTTDRTVQMIQEGFDKAIGNGMKDVAKQALEYRLIDKRCFGRILRDSIIINDLDTLMILTKENPEKEYYNAYKRALQMAAEEGNLEVVRYIVGKMNSEDRDCCDRIIRKSVKDSGKSKEHIDFLESCGGDVDRVMRIGRYRKKAAAT